MIKGPLKGGVAKTTKKVIKQKASFQQDLLKMMEVATQPKQNVLERADSLINNLKTEMASSNPLANLLMRMSSAKLKEIEDVFSQKVGGDTERRVSAMASKVFDIIPERFIIWPTLSGMFHYSF